MVGDVANAPVNRNDLQMLFASETKPGSKTLGFPEFLRILDIIAAGLYPEVIIASCSKRLAIMIEFALCLPACRFSYHCICPCF